MYYEPLNIVDGHIYAYLLVDAHTYDILDGNELARTLYIHSSRYPHLTSLFSQTADEHSLSAVIEELAVSQSTTLKNIVSTKSNGDTFPCYIEICKLNSDLLFLIIKEHCLNKDAHINQLVELVDNPVIVLTHDAVLTSTFANRRCMHCFHFNKEDFTNGCNPSFLFLLKEEKRLSFLQTINQQFDLYGECDVDMEIEVDTEYVQLFRFNAFKSIYDGQLYGVLISAKKQRDLMKKIEYDQQYFDIMQQFSKDLLFRIDIKKRTLVHRGDISKFVGLEPEVGNFPESMRLNRLVHPDDLEGYIAFAYRMMNGEIACFEPRFQFINGTFERYRLQGNPLFDTEGNTVQVVGKSENIQKYVEIETKANYDSLTSTLNKQSFRELIEHSLERAVESDKFALLFIDLDDFKGVNDTLGHVFGDFLLEAMGKRIKNCIRSQDRVGRVGGDEFVVFFRFAPSHEVVQERAEAILHSLRREFTYGEQRRKLKASIGIALFPEHGKSYDDLYHHADLALYRSKELGKDIATIYYDTLG